MPALEERPEYPYQNIRTRNFPWGDGDKVCIPMSRVAHSLKARLLTHNIDPVVRIRNDSNQLSIVEKTKGQYSRKPD